MLAPKPVPILTEAPAPLSDVEQEVVQKRFAELQKLLADNNSRAKYKLELAFGKARSDRHATPGMLSFWENGSKLHGGGDAKLYLCPSRYLKVGTCQAVIPDLANQEGTLVCPTCGQFWKGEQVIGELLFNLPMHKWAEVLYNYFCLFEQSCDLYLKHAPDDIRSVALAQSKHQTWRGSKMLNRSRVTRARVIYRLSAIIADTANGSDPRRRFFMFLTA
jgi:hypothetical protein